MSNHERIKTKLYTATTTALAQLDRGLTVHDRARLARAALHAEIVYAAVSGRAFLLTDAEVSHAR